MRNTRDTGTIGAIAFLAGVAIGVLGLFTTNKAVNRPTTSEPDPIDELNLTGEEEIPDAKFENITPDSTTIIDSLEGIEVAGEDADLLKVRVLSVERAKAVAMWGYKGINGDEKAKFRRLVDLTTEHLLNIKKNSQRVSQDERRIIDSILEDRVAAGEADEAILSV